ASGAIPVAIRAPLVGRDREMADLEALLRAAVTGHGGALAVSGEAGIGKSRIKWEAARLAREMGMTVHEGRAISFGGMFLWSIAELLRSVISVREGSKHAQVLDRVQAEAESCG